MSNTPFRIDTKTCFDFWELDTKMLKALIDKAYISFMHPSKLSLSNRKEKDNKEKLKH
jgi:hypothetical protein